MEVGKTGNPSAIALNGSDIYIEWSAAENAASYKIYRSLTTDGGYSEIAQVSKCEYIAKGLSTNTTYYFKVRGVGADGTLGQYSGAGGATTLADAEQGFITKVIMEDIADAIREKIKSEEIRFPVEMAALIRGIHTVPDGITEIEVVTCAGSNTYTLTVPCSLSDDPICVAIYRDDVSTDQSVLQTGVWAHDKFAFWYGSGYTNVRENASPLSSGVLTLRAYIGTGNPRFYGTYRCVMWR